ncbi:hypothetical protein SAMN05421636_103267 [Pricia antarctica]|uniref:Uncharacterized protein n=1 Tax=Pricia antarctica TaxID=641691 RepID=A0A1G7A8C5_9FLAO|nr:hypothetical protein [Pricia antarctica]SDE10737.1 hypothetical protein SAMN05421636_103267 [Pricia antarctica]
MAKLATYYIENHKIEVVKTLFGKEKVLLNGTQISEKTSGDTTQHHFEIAGHRYTISQRDSSQSEKMNAYQILRNESPIALINIESQTSIKILVLIVAIGLGLGFMVGVLVYNLVL